MGQKVNPIGMRLQVNRTWDSRWYADDKDYGNLLLEDLKIRDFIKTEAKQAGISRVIIERPHRKCRVTIHAARPGVIIGKKGADIEVLRNKLANFTKSEVHLNIVGPSGIAKAACPCTPCAPTSTMPWPKPRPLTGSSG